MGKVKDLTHYCDKLDQLEGKKGVMADLSKWISDDDVDVFWRQNSDRYPTFTSVSHPAPDILIDGVGELYAVRVVQAEEQSEKIRKAAREIVDIWDRMVNDPPEYDIELSTEKPSAVLIATERSRKGHLFSGNKNRENPVEFSEERQNLADKGVLPQREFAATQELTRMTWQFAKDRNWSVETGIGALLSSRLDSKEDSKSESYEPAAFYYMPKSERVHGWEAIPWYLWK